MSNEIKTGITFSGSLAMSEPSRTPTEQAILDMPETLFWARGDTQDATQSKIAFRDVVGGLLCQGQGTTQCGSGVNGAATMKFDGTPTSRLVASGLIIPASFSIIALYSLAALPPGSPAISPLISDPNFQTNANPEFAFGNVSGTGRVELKVLHSGSNIAVGSTTNVALNTPTISWCSQDGATLNAGIATNHRAAEATLVLGGGVSGASTMIIGGGGAFYVFDGEISDLIVLSVPIHETPYATQRDTVLNFLATKGGVTLS